MNNATLPPGHDDIIARSRELVDLLAGIRDGRAWFQRSSGEFIVSDDRPENLADDDDDDIEPADLSMWLNTHLDVETFYKPKRNSSGFHSAGCEFVGFHVLITCGGPSVWLECYERPIGNGRLSLHHSWGWDTRERIVGEGGRECLAVDMYETSAGPLPMLSIEDWMMSEMAELFAHVPLQMGR